MPLARPLVSRRHSSKPPAGSPASVPESITAGIVNFGCGPFATPGYINIDGSSTVLLSRLPVPAGWFYPKAAFVSVAREARIRYGRARRLRFPEGSLNAFYSSHTLEHLPRRHCLDLMNRVRGWLRPGGVVRVVLPDLRRMGEAYAAGVIDADTFLRKTYLATESNSLVWRLIGGGVHHWMYDAASFGKLLQRLGFREVQQTEFGMSRLAELSRLDIKERRHESFYIEAIR